MSFGDSSVNVLEPSLAASNLHILRHQSLSARGSLAGPLISPAVRALPIGTINTNPDLLYSSYQSPILQSGGPLLASSRLANTYGEGIRTVLNRPLPQLPIIPAAIRSQPQLLASAEPCDIEYGTGLEGRISIERRLPLPPPVQPLPQLVPQVNALSRASIINAEEIGLPLEEENLIHHPISEPAVELEHTRPIGAIPPPPPLLPLPQITAPAHIPVEIRSGILPGPEFIPHDIVQEDDGQYHGEGLYHGEGQYYGEGQYHDEGQYLGEEQYRGDGQYHGEGEEESYDRPIPIQSVPLPPPVLPLPQQPIAPQLEIPNPIPAGAFLPNSDFISTLPAQGLPLPPIQSHLPPPPPPLLELPQLAPPPQIIPPLGGEIQQLPIAAPGLLPGGLPPDCGPSQLPPNLDAIPFEQEQQNLIPPSESDVVISAARSGLIGAHPSISAPIQRLSPSLPTQPLISRLGPFRPDILPQLDRSSRIWDQPITGILPPRENGILPITPNILRSQPVPIQSAVQPLNLPSALTYSQLPVQLDSRIITPPALRTHPLQEDPCE